LSDQLQEAARERQTTIGLFLIESALTTEQEVLAERTRIGLAALDGPPQHHPRMERLLKQPTTLD
jgi:uncharacterized protein (DUF1778 family)